VFLSYASEDAEAAQRICEALRAAGIEVWFDKSELRGGDVWDQKIRRQIRHCALFIPIISGHSQARLEGYFRREWKFAVERKRDIADELAFLLPVVIDETPERGAAVPEGFHEVQWTRLQGRAASQEFVAHVSRLLASNKDGPRPSGQVSQASVGAAPAQPASGSKSGSHSRMWLMVAAAAIAGIVGYIGMDRYVLRKGTPPSVARPASAKGDKSIAVLPFVNLSSDKEQEYFADGMTEEVIDLLANIPDLKVIGRTSSFQFKGRNPDLRAVGTTLGVNYVVEGSVRRSGERLRVTAQLINAEDGSHLWSDTYDKPVGDAFNVQDQVATDVARALQLSVGGAGYHSGRASFKSAEAYDLFLRGLHAFNRYDKEGFESAAAYFQQVVELDPTSVLAAEWLADVQGNIASFGYGEPRETFERARRAAQRALALDPKSSEAYTDLASVEWQYDWDWSAAERDAKEALRLNPHNPSAIGTLGTVYATIGRWNESARLFESAISFDSLDPIWYSNLSNALYASGRMREAEAEARKFLQISPTFETGHSLLGYLLLAQGKLEAALSEMQQEQDDSYREFGLAMVYYAMRRRVESDAALAQLSQKHAEDHAYLVAGVYAYRQEPDKAFMWLERSYRQRDSGLNNIKGMQVDPLTRTLGLDPRFAAFLQKMNLPE
jgi:TolB-like protein/Tfp pilus assembly protein PilF